MLKRLFKLVTNIEKKKRALLKQGCDCISKLQQISQTLLAEERSMLQTIKNIYYIKFITSHE